MELPVSDQDKELEQLKRMGHFFAAQLGSRAAQNRRRRYGNP
jgi:hypothetical protein